MEKLALLFQIAWILDRFMLYQLYMRIRAFKYVSPFILYWLAYWSFTAHGYITFFPLVWSYTFIPLLELLVTPDPVNMSSTEE